MRHFVRFLLFGVVLSTTAFAADNSPLASSSSAFARAQASSAIKWHVWNEKSLAAAKASGKSVYVFIGSPLSELTRATIAQTFTSEKTVTWLNESFFCLFVDADAQPEVAALGQHFITVVKQLKGQPVHLWLAPDTLEPYDGANYLPPSEEWGKPGFLKAARAALETWQTSPDRAHALAAEAISMMALPPLEKGEVKAAALKARLDRAAAAWIATVDAKHGGFGPAPKLPEPELIRFLLTRDKPAQDAAIQAARALVAGALRDPVDGGFYRRCIDEGWKEPYFQKTLLDQARIALALFEAADVAKDAKLRAAGTAALDFVLKELRHSDGTFAAALDGTLEENTDPAKRPAFVRVGRASIAAQALFVRALKRSGEQRLSNQTLSLATPLMLAIFPAVKPRDGGRTGTAADHLALALLAPGGEKLLAAANDAYFDPVTGTYQATAVQLPAGIAARVPASGDTPSAEVLALLAGVDAKTADLIRRNLLTQIEYDELPPGDILLGLSQRQK